MITALRNDVGAQVVAGVLVFFSILVGLLVGMTAGLGYGVLSGFSTAVLGGLGGMIPVAYARLYHRAARR